MTKILRHPLLGLIRGRQVTTDLVQYSGIPYATVSQRFARSTILHDLNTSSAADTFEATSAGPECIQPENATKLDSEANQFPHDDFKEQPQSADCLYLNIATPSDPPASPLPVLLFIHGGAYFLGSSTRPYYSPSNFLTHALSTNKPLIFVSLNYRLGTLGFLHTPHASTLIPPNNGLHDQLRAFEWIHANITGFGGDPSRITALGQSAGGESLSLHSISSNPTPLFKQMICFSGSPATMPCKTPEGHHDNFLKLAGKLGIEDAEQKDPEEVAKQFINAPISKIRDLAMVGAPCSSSELLPYDHPTMALTRNKPDSNVNWIQRAIYSSTTFDGGISYNLLIKTPKAKNCAQTFTAHVHDKLSPRGAKDLLSLYGIKEDDSDVDGLKKICQFESDIGFFAASLAQVQGSPALKKYLQIFDLKNPFDASNSAAGSEEKGGLEKGMWATHTWDIVALLGAYDEMLERKELDVVRRWRDRILEFVYEGETEGWPAWDEEEGRKALRVDKTGLEVQGWEEYMGEDGSRRKKLLEIAQSEKGEDGWDFLWEGVCRTWLDG